MGCPGRPAEDLLARLDQLQQEAPELDLALLAKIRRQLQDGDRQARLARALSGRSPYPAGPAADRPREPTERLAEAVLSATTAIHGHGEPPEAVAERLLRSLPALDDLPPELRRGCLHLFVWAALVLRRFDPVCAARADPRTPAGTGRPAGTGGDPWLGPRGPAGRRSR